MWYYSFMKRVILAGVCIKEKAFQFETKIQECIALCQACDLDVIQVITQNTNTIDTRTAFRKGKIEELAQAVQLENIELVVFYNALSIQMAQRISMSVQCDVIDRTALILNIFSTRAKSRQAKLQVEMARLHYDLPRILQSNHDGERQRGGSVNNRGAGEMRSAMIAQKYNQRIHDLKVELEKIEKQRYQDEKRRTKTLFPRVALVGYTNAGKSSFMNYCLQYTKAMGTKVFEKDMLFATLDTSVRKITYKQKTFLLYDTVGFVSDLPHMLIEAFQTTLSSAKEADFLIEIVDISDNEYEEKMEVTRQTLETIGAQDIPVLKLFNKIDLVQDKMIEGIPISIKTQKNMEQAMDAVIKMVFPKEEKMRCYLPYDKINVLDTYKQLLHIRIERQDDNGMYLDISGPKRYMQAFMMYRIEGNIYE